MIDTMRWRLWAEGLPESDYRWKGGAIPPGWSVQEHCGSEFDSWVEDRQGRTSRRDKPVKRSYMRWMYIHDKTGMRVGGTKDVATWVEVSAPRLLYGSNGYLVKDQDELDSAVYRCEEYLRKLIVAPRGQGYTRLDLVWHLAQDPRKGVLFHRLMRHRRIRKSITEYQHQGVEYPGCDRRFRFYDKQLEAHGVPGMVSRPELQMRNDALKDVLGGSKCALPEVSSLGVFDSRLDFAHLYDCYRRFCLGFAPVQFDVSNPVDAQGKRVKPIVALCAMAAREGWEYQGANFMELLENGLLGRSMSKATIYRYKRELKNVLPEKMDFDYSKLLPEGGPPDPVEVPELVRSAYKRGSVSWQAAQKTACEIQATAS